MITVLLVLIVVGFLLWLVNSGTIPIDGVILKIINVVAIVLVVLYLLKVFGIFDLIDQPVPRVSN